MKTRLLFPDQDFDFEGELPWNESDLRLDLGLDTLVKAMAMEDEFLLDIARRVLLSSLSSHPDTIRYRQDILRDCIRNEPTVRQIYELAVEAVERERKDFWGTFTNYPPATLHHSIGVMEMFLDVLHRLRALADESASEFDSAGFSRFFAMLKGELSEEYFDVVRDHLKRLQFPKGVLISAHLGMGNKGSEYVLRRSVGEPLSLVDRILGRGAPAYSFEVDNRDVNGAKALSDLKGRGINLAANALAQSVEHILSFFGALRSESAFYVGCLNLRQQLVEMNEPVCFPEPCSDDERELTFRDLYDPGLALTTGKPVVGNTVDARSKALVIITGANQGGKSTFLRSIGLAQLMMQSGMLVCAERFSANVCRGVFTHFGREEDTEMESGRLDEELGRMSAIVEHLESDAMILFNESFASTNPREGSQIASQIVRALLEAHVKTFFVTHLFEFADGFNQRDEGAALFLRAERKDSRERTFRLKPGRPQETSYGADLFQEVFGQSVR